MNNKRDHYVYLYVDPRDGEVFYIGQGKENRMMVHLRPSQRKLPSPKNDKINKIMGCDIHPMIVVIESELTESEALNSERRWIACFGVENLTNKTTGGQGVSGFSSFKGRKHTKEAKDKCRESKLGDKNPMFGKKRSKEALAKFSEKMRGRCHHYYGKNRSEETRGKISRSLSGYQWSESDKKKRSEGMSRVWEERRKTGNGMPRHKRMMVECNGVKLSIDEWVEKTGINKGTLRARLKRGWSIDRALGLDV